MKKYKAIFINARLKTIELVEIKKELGEWYKIIGYNCECVELITYFGSNGLLIDENGRFEHHGYDSETKKYFGFKIDVGSSAGKFIESFEVIGNGILIGHNEDGETVNVDYDIEDIRKRVMFIPSPVVKAMQELFNSN
jgi:hypothetical protein